MDRYNKPKLIFRKVEDHPLCLIYGNAYYPGCFTSTGLPYDNEEYPLMLEWCEKMGCGKKHEYMPYHLIFETEEDMTWFLLHWG